MIHVTVQQTILYGKVVCWILEEVAFRVTVISLFFCTWWEKMSRIHDSGL